MLRLAAFLVLGSVVFAAGGHRWTNPGLLGIISIQTKDGVEIAHVLKKSPAERAKLKAGDRLLTLAGARIKRPLDVDTALKSVAPGKEVEVVVEREGKKTTLTAKLMDRKKYKGALLKRRQRGATGHKMEPWFGYGWANVKKGEEPPTLANTKGKVVVFHTFQSW